MDDGGEAQVTSREYEGRGTPEDRVIRERGEAYGRRFGAEFAEDYAKALAKVVSTHSDAEAEEMMWMLRGDFWIGEWERRKYGRNSLVFTDGVES